MSYQTKLDIIVKVDENRNINAVYTDIDHTDMLEDCVVHYGLRAIFGSTAVNGALGCDRVYEQLSGIPGVVSVETALINTVVETDL